MQKTLLSSLDLNLNIKASKTAFGWNFTYKIFNGPGNSVWHLFDLLHRSQHPKFQELVQIVKERGGLFSSGKDSLNLREIPAHFKDLKIKKDLTEEVVEEELDLLISNLKNKQWYKTKYTEQEYVDWLLQEKGIAIEVDSYRDWWIFQPFNFYFRPHTMQAKVLKHISTCDRYLDPRESMFFSLFNHIQKQFCCYSEIKKTAGDQWEKYQDLRTWTLTPALYPLWLEFVKEVIIHQPAEVYQDIKQVLHAFPELEQLDQNINHKELSSFREFGLFS